jgi:polysaccharide pyruvyl transferase WcaK-like protein
LAASAAFPVLANEWGRPTLPTQNDGDVRPSVGIFGTFDVRNYGDLLFPLIAQFRLQQHGIDVVAYSPRGGSTGWQDTVDCLPLPRSFDQAGRHSAFIVGGGNIIHRKAANLAEYPGTMNDWAYSGIWGGASVLGAVANRPILWNSPGVQRPFADKDMAEIVRSAIRACDYLSVRDEQSRTWLNAPNDVEVCLVPDTAVEIARMWPKPSLREHHQRLSERKCFGRKEPYFTLHVKRRSVDLGQEQALASAIDAYAAASGHTPLLLAIGPCHGDEVMTRQLGQLLKTRHVLVDEPLGLREMAAAIAFSESYIGCSLHGYITAAAFRVPARLVAIPDIPKHAGFLAHVERSQDLRTSWIEALRDVVPRRKTAVPTHVFKSVDEHWARLVQLISQPLVGGYERRTRFLRTFVRNGLSTAGWDWASEGLLPSPRLSRP